MNKDFEEWYELESDPGIFSLLLESLGVKGVEVIDVYDLDNLGDDVENIFGFIFLHKWVEDKKRRKNIVSEELPKDSYVVVNNDKINSIFFAKQVISNSCATLALLSIVMNSFNLNIGPKLNELKSISLMATPEDKGLCIANMKELAILHNQFAKGNPVKLNKIKCDTSRLVSSSTSKVIYDETSMSQTSLIDTQYENQLTSDNLLLSPNHVKNHKIHSSPGAVSDKLRNGYDVNECSKADGKNIKNGGENTVISNHHLSINTHQSNSCSTTLISPNQKTSNLPHSDDDCFHYVSFLPSDGELLELDGLRSNPISHGKWSRDESWTEKFKILIKDRINRSLINNIHERHNLMAVRKDVRYLYRKKIMSAKSDLLSLLDTMTNVFHMHGINVLINNSKFSDQETPHLCKYMENSLPIRVKRKCQDYHLKLNSNAKNFNPNLKNFLCFATQLNAEILGTNEKLKKENDKWDQYRIEHARRTHDYFPFIQTFLRALDNFNLLENLIYANPTSPILPRRLKR